MIKFNSVTKTFGDGTTALKDISFEIESGELVLITGPSGSGKTTIINLLLKEHTPSSGEIIFDEYEVHNLKSSKIPQHRRQIGVVFQDYKLIPDLTIWENIALPLQISNKNQHEIETRVTDLLTLINLEEKAWVFPKQLSGGEAQRVSIARSLATGPNLIFADEPTGNLDSATSLGITKLFKKINELGTTLLLATHDENVLTELKSSRIINLKKGEITKDTKTKKKIKKQPKKNETEKTPIDTSNTKTDTKKTKNRFSMVVKKLTQSTDDKKNEKP